MKLRYLVLILFAAIATQSMYAASWGPRPVLRLLQNPVRSKVVEKVGGAGLGVVVGTFTGTFGFFGGAAGGFALSFPVEGLALLVAPKIKTEGMREALTCYGAMAGGIGGGLGGAALFARSAGAAGFATALGGVAVGLKYLESRQQASKNK